MSTAGRRRIFIIDDSSLLLGLAKTALERAGFEVRAAETLDQLSALLAGPGPDAVLIDVCMPEAFGDDLGRVLRARHGLTVPILLYSDLDDGELAARARDAEVDGYISKRAGLPVMVARVRALFDTAPSSEVAEIQALFLPRFLETARNRLATCLEAAGAGVEAAGTAVLELHSIAGEAAAVGLAALADRARAAEADARAWGQGAAGSSVARIREGVAALASEVERLRAERKG